MSAPDPLDERDEKIAEVQNKRLLEEMDRDNENLALAQLLELEGFRDYLWTVIAKCGTLNEAFDPNYGKMAYTSGRQSVGRMLIADINLANPQAWLSMQLKAADLAQKAERAKALKQLRKAR